MLSNDVNRTVTDVMLYYSVGVSSDLTQSHGVATVRARPRENILKWLLPELGLILRRSTRADENRVYSKVVQGQGRLVIVPMMYVYWSATVIHLKRSKRFFFDRYWTSGH